jgi:REP element-mobilizing transposase RayT
MTPYDPKIHHRKSIRLKEYDYSQTGFYFITLVCEKRIHRFGKIKNGKMLLNEYGEIAFNEWLALSERFSAFKINVFQIMPDHFHSIIELVGAKNQCINESVGATLAVAQNTDVADIVGAYKSLVLNKCLVIYKSKNIIMGKLWQRNYYEHIIRNDLAYTNISNYIINNPLKWTER